MKKLFKSELLLLVVFIIIFVSIRSVYFTEHLNFFDDQATQATDVLQDYRLHKIPLIGNQVTSTGYKGHFLFQGPAYYYMLFPFLLLANFEPISSTYLFMLFCSVMIIPLYYGVKLLIDKRAAWLMVIIYTLAPYYVNYTRFHWNPNYQLALMPILILLMGLYKKYTSQKYFFLVAVFLGILFQFHYQFFLVVLGLAIYYFLIKKVSPLLLLHFFVGFILGVSPLLLFEVKHDFYNIRTFILIASHYKEVHSAGNFLTPHYYLSITFILLTGAFAYFKNYLPKGRSFIVACSVLAIILFGWTALVNFPKPDQATLSPNSFWSYPDEYHAYQIIKSQNLKDYNVANLAYYNTESFVIKFLLKRENVVINYDDYFHNKYLFVIKRSNTRIFDTLSYEVAIFKPSKVLKTWKLNDHYMMYLLKRT